MRIRFSAMKLVAGISLLGGIAACGMTDFPSYFAGVEGSQQTVAVGAQAATPLTVLVKDQEGEPLSGVVVQYEIKSGEGTLSAPSATTGKDGKASVTYTAGSTTGVTIISATVPGTGAVGFTMTVK